MSYSQVKIEGPHIRGTRYRAILDQKPGATFAVTNIGPATLEHSATRDLGTPTTLAAGATANITGTRWARSVGKSVLMFDDVNGRVDGRIDDGRAS